MRVNQIPEEGKSVNLKVDANKANKYFTLLKNSDFSATTDVEGKMMVWCKEGMVIVEGEVSVELELTCSRCLSSFCYPVFHHFRSIYSPFQEMCEVGDVELKPHDMDVSIYNGVEVDLENVLYEQVVMGIPARPLCSQDCKGLCPVCGVNLNEGLCQCHKQIHFSPFDVLKNLKVKG